MRKKRNYVKARNIPEGGQFVKKYGTYIYTRVPREMLLQLGCRSTAIVGIAQHGWPCKVRSDDLVVLFGRKKRKAIGEDGKPVPNAVDIKVRHSMKMVSHPYWWEIDLTIDGFTDGIISNIAFKTAGEAVAGAAKAMATTFGHGSKYKEG